MPDKRPRNYEFDDAKGEYKEFKVPKKATPSGPTQPRPQAVTGPTQRANDAMFGTNVRVHQQQVQPTGFEHAMKDVPQAMAGKGYYQDYLKGISGIQQQLQARGGGGGGGAGQMAGLGTYQGQVTDYMRGLMDPSQNPFGQAATNVRTRDIDMGTQQQLDQIKADFASRGQAGSPQEAAALRDAQHQAGLGRSSVIQNVAEASAQYKLQAGESIAQWATQLGDYDIKDRAAKRAASNASRGMAMANLRLNLQLEGMKYSAGSEQDARLMNFHNSTRRADMADLQGGTAEQTRQKERMQDFEWSQMLAKKSAAAGRKSNLWGTIGSIVGGIGGAVLGPVGAAAGSALAGSIFGGDWNQSATGSP